MRAGAPRTALGVDALLPADADKAIAAARDAELGSAGLPIGVQIAARPFREDVLLSIMSALESVGSDAPRTPIASSVTIT